MNSSHSVTELVAVLVSSPVLFVPSLEDLLETRRRSLGVNSLGVLLGDFVRNGSQVGNVTTNEEIGVEVRKFDLLRQVCL